MYAQSTLLISAAICFFWGSHAAVQPSSSLHTIIEASRPRDVKQVAIIGAGAAGSSAAYHLQKFANRSRVAVNITVFERSDYVGGRSKTVNAYNDSFNPVELGASIFVQVNTILKNATEEFNLSARNRVSVGDEPEILGIWNGDKFVYTQKEGGWAWWDITKLIWKYGMAPIRTQNLMKATMGKFLKLYEAPFFPFRSLSDRAYDLDLTSVTAMTGEQYLAINNVKGSFTTDIIQASTRVNYGQNLGVIHGLETMVCMAIEGAMQIEGGNWHIFDQMLKASGADLHLNTTVANIGKKDGKFILKTSLVGDGKSATTIESVFDSVILTAPFQFSGINVEEGLVKHLPDEIPYVKLHVTLFASPLKLDPAHFNMKEGDEMPNTILTTLPPDDVPGSKKMHAGKAGFFSISTLRTVTKPKTTEREYLYKIFSPEAITSSDLQDLFAMQDLPSDISKLDTSTSKEISWYYPFVWNSYPIEMPRVTFEELELAMGFYYTSGIESFISTMETSALMGMNVAQLILDDYLEVLNEKPVEDLERFKVQVSRTGLGYKVENPVPEL